MKLSRFVHVFQIADVYAYYNSLFLRPVFLSKEEHLLLSTQSFCTELLENIQSELLENKILVQDDNDDEKLLQKTREKLLLPYPTIAYFILSEKCNLACKYCFLGNSDVNITKSQMPSMSLETANAAIEYFFYQSELHSEWNHFTKEIVFYGGEPLINFQALKHIVKRFEAIKKERRLKADINFSIITNGLLLTEDKIEFIKNHNIAVSISIDGIDEESNLNRVDKKGKTVFHKLKKILSLVCEKRLNVGLSITLTEKTISSVENIISLLAKYNINAISFNLLYSVKGYKTNEDYYKRASKFIIDFYKKTRNMDIYEDRIMRKVNAFVEGEQYLSDCAATSGSQIVILPNGDVGVCQGCIENKEFFFTNVYDRKPLDMYSVMQDWSRISPVNKFECLSCEALGICGGGCPIHARNNSTDGDINSIDRGFCVHAKLTLRFLIEDIYKILLSKREM